MHWVIVAVPFRIALACWWQVWCPHVLQLCPGRSGMALFWAMFASSVGFVMSITGVVWVSCLFSRHAIAISSPFSSCGMSCWFLGTSILGM